MAAYFFELGLALVSLACVIALKPPPSDRKKVFKKVISLPSFSAGARHGAGVRQAVAGRLEWWLGSAVDRLALAAAVLPIVADYLEHNRSNPAQYQMAFQRQHRASGHDYAVDPHRAGGAEHRGVIGWLQYVGLQTNR